MCCKKVNTFMLEIPTHLCALCEVFLQWLCVHLCYCEPGFWVHKACGKWCAFFFFPESFCARELWNAGVGLQVCFGGCGVYCCYGLTDRSQKTRQEVGNSFGGKDKMKKEASFHWFCYGTGCIYKGILKILINTLKLWGNIDLHD